MNSLHGLLNCETGELECHVITTEYRTRVHCVHMYHLFCNALVRVIYSGVSGQCSHTISKCAILWCHGDMFSLISTLTINTRFIPSEPATGPQLFVPGDLVDGQEPVNPVTCSANLGFPSGQLEWHIKQKGTIIIIIIT